MDRPVPQADANSTRSRLSFTKRAELPRLRRATGQRVPPGADEIFQKNFGQTFSWPLISAPIGGVKMLRVAIGPGLVADEMSIFAPSLCSAATPHPGAIV